MKLFHYLLLLCFCLSLSVEGQMPPPGGEPGQGPGMDMKRGEKIKALYVAYITEELKLSEEEAQKFWPIHAQYDAEFKALKRDLPELDRQQSILNIKKKYQDKFAKTLGATRADEFYRKDEEFRKKMLDRLQQMRENRGNNRPPDGPPQGRNKRRSDTMGPE